MLRRRTSPSSPTATTAAGTAAVLSAPAVDTPTATTRVTRLSEQDAVDQVIDLRNQLLAQTQEDLAGVVKLAYDWQLTPTAAGLYDELTSTAWLAGLPSLPCCNHHDVDTIEAWVAGVNQICETGTLPA